MNLGVVAVYKIILLKDNIMSINADVEPVNVMIGSPVV